MEYYSAIKGCTTDTIERSIPMWMKSLNVLMGGSQTQSMMRVGKVSV